LRVRLVASVPVRRRWWAEARRLEPARARDEIERLERQRASFIQGHFGVAADDPLRHDLVINLDGVTAGFAVEMILAARQILRRKP
jgi:hypothetical protein